MSRCKDYMVERRDNYDTISFRLRWQKEEIKGEWFDGVHLDPCTIPDGKYLYETRHSDLCDNLSMPASIKCTQIRVNFCGSVVTDKPITLKGKELTYEDEWSISQRSVCYDSGIYE